MVSDVSVPLADIGRILEPGEREREFAPRRSNGMQTSNTQQQITIQTLVHAMSAPSRCRRAPLSRALRSRTDPGSKGAASRFGQPREPPRYSLLPRRRDSTGPFASTHRVSPEKKSVGARETTTTTMTRQRRRLLRTTVLFAVMNTTDCYGDRSRLVLFLCLCLFLSLALE